MTQSIYDNCPDDDSHFRIVQCDKCGESYEAEFYWTDQDDEEPRGADSRRCRKCGSKYFTVYD